MTGGIQAVIRVRISLPDGRSGQGVAAEALAAKWFEKSPEFTDEQNLDQLRQSLDLAIEHYRAHGADTPFGLFAGTYSEQQKKGAALRLNPLVASYGPALLDRAILDALGKITGNSFAQMIASATCRASGRPSSRRTSSRSRSRASSPALKPGATRSSCATRSAWSIR